MTIRILLLAAVAATAVAACGGGAGADPSAQKGPNDKQRKSLLQFAQCMRDHGVDMKDPTFDDGGARVTMSAGGPGGKLDKSKVEAAQKACQKYQQAAAPHDVSDADKEKFRKAALKNAQCMRDHGIDMPDPQFDDNGGARMTMGKGIDPNSAKFQAAQKACAGTLPFGGTTKTDGGK